LIESLQSLGISWVSPPIATEDSRSVGKFILHLPVTLLDEPCAFRTDEFTVDLDDQRAVHWW